jgi:hypothetical protein
MPQRINSRLRRKRLGNVARDQRSEPQGRNHPVFANSFASQLVIEKQNEILPYVYHEAAIIQTLPDVYHQEAIKTTLPKIIFGK